MAAVVEEVDNCKLKQRANSDVNPNVKCELEKLNAATDGINHLETEFEEANALMEKMVNEALDLLSKSAKKMGKSSIEKASLYFQLHEKLQRNEDDLQDTERWYEEAVKNVSIAKAKATQAEQKALSSQNKMLDPDVQEDINQANVEFAKAVNKKNDHMKRYETCQESCADLRRQMEHAGKKYEKQIKKTWSYFELKKSLYKGLQQQRERVDKIGEGICFAKEQYAKVLGNLENISEEIHRRRRSRKKASSLTKDGEASESFRKSMNEASLNESEQKKLTEYMANIDSQEKDEAVQESTKL